MLSPDPVSVRIKRLPGNDDLPLPAYATDGAAVRRFNLSGGGWGNGNITGNLPAMSNITELAVDPNNANHVVLSVNSVILPFLL